MAGRATFGDQGRGAKVCVIELDRWVPRGRQIAVFTFAENLVVAAQPIEELAGREGAMLPLVGADLLE